MSIDIKLCYRPKSTKNPIRQKFLVKEETEKAGNTV